MYLNKSINQLRLTLSTLHAEIYYCKHIISTVVAIHVESWNHEELRYFGLTPIALCELMSLEQFCRGEMYFAVNEDDFAMVKLIWPWRN